MPKGVLYFLIVVVAVAAVATVIINDWIPGALKPAARIPATLEQEFGVLPQVSGRQSPAGSNNGAGAGVALQGTVLAAGAAPAEPRPDPPIVSSVQGGWGRNPFLTLEEIDFLRNPRKYEVVPDPPSIRLSMILTDPSTGKRKATLGGHDLFVGDMLGTEKVVHISPYSMTLRGENGKTREIQLHELAIPFTTSQRRK